MEAHTYTELLTCQIQCKLLTYDNPFNPVEQVPLVVSFCREESEAQRLSVHREVVSEVIQSAHCGLGSAEAICLLGLCS